MDKPAGITSHDVVARLRRAFSTRRVGHGGTLDPMATGLLIVGIGNGTKLLQFAMDTRKVYRATVRLGFTSNTDDAEGEIQPVADPLFLTYESIRAAFASQVGLLNQVPPQFSAIKVAGERSYAKARAGQTTELAAREVEIFGIEVIAIRREAESIFVDFEVECGKGTYIRAIARDVGQNLQVGGYLTALRRTVNSGFTESEAVSLDQVTEGLIDLATAAKRFLPIIEISPDEFAQVGNGQQLVWRWEDLPNAVGVIWQERLVAVGYRSGQRLAYHSVLA